MSTEGVYVEVLEKPSVARAWRQVPDVCCLQPAFMARRRQEARATQAPSSCGEPLEDDAFLEYPSVYHPQVGLALCLMLHAFKQEGCQEVRPNEAGVQLFGASKG